MHWVLAIGVFFGTSEVLAQAIYPPYNNDKPYALAFPTSKSWPRGGAFTIVPMAGCHFVQHWMQGANVNYPEPETGAEYLTQLRAFLRWLWDPEILTEGKKTPRHWRELQHVGGNLAQMLEFELLYRDYFLKTVRKGGVRLIERPFSWELRYKNYPTRSVSEALATQFLAHQIDEKTFFSHRELARIQPVILDEWIRFLRQAGEPDLFLRTLRDCQHQACRTAQKNLVRLQQLLRELGQQARLFEFLQGATLLTPASGWKPQVRAMAELLKIKKPAQFEKMLVDRMDCRVPALQAALVPITLVEQMQDKTWRPPHFSQQLKSDWVRNRPWLGEYDLANAFTVLLREIRGCEKRYDLLKALYLAYEDSELALHYPLQREIVQAGKVAALAEGRGVKGASVAKPRPRSRHSWFRKWSGPERSWAKKLADYGRADGYQFHRPDAAVRNLIPRWAELRIRFDATRASVVVSAQGVQGGRMSVLCSPDCQVKFELNLVAQLERLSLLCQVKSLETFPCEVTNRKGTHIGKVELDEDD